MIIFPAIDIKGGRCVRLYKGDFATVHQVADSCLETARAFQKAGAQWVHMVDLDGARSGVVANEGVFLDVARETGLKVELGGGIRNMQTVERYLSQGIERVVLGSAAVKDPVFVREAIQAYGEHIAIGIDATDGLVACEGWVDASAVHYLELARRMEDIGARYIIFTDISRDGMLSGPNLEQLAALSEAVSCGIIASGGIKDIEDIRLLAELGLYGAICGKALYAGTLTLSDAIRQADAPDWV